MEIRTILVLVGIITALSTGAASAIMTTTQTAFARVNDCSKDTGEVCLAGGERTNNPANSGGSGGHTTCDAEGICTVQGGRGGNLGPESSDQVGGQGFRITGDFGAGDTDRVGGSGQHPQGPGGNSGN